jgi:acyl carrier protein
MNDTEVRSQVLQALAQVAPEADLEGLDPSGDFREELDLDSMDILNLVIGLHEATGVDIPERDYPQLVTLDACVSYLSERLAPA